MRNENGEGQAEAAGCPLHAESGTWGNDGEFHASDDTRHQGGFNSAAETEEEKLYKAMVDTKPPKGDPAAFKEKVEKLIAATQEVVDKKPDAAAHYKEAVNCKDCHSQFRPPPPGK